MDKEKWIEEILQSAKAVQPVPSNAFMITRIEAKLQQPVVLNKLPLQWVYASAAILLVLLVMNISILRNPVQQKAAGVQQLIQEYGWDNSDLYSVNPLNTEHE